MTSWTHWIIAKGLVVIEKQSVTAARISSKQAVQSEKNTNFFVKSISRNFSWNWYLFFFFTFLYNKEKRYEKYHIPSLISKFFLANLISAFCKTSVFLSHSWNWLYLYKAHKYIIRIEMFSTYTTYINIPVFLKDE